MNSILLVSHVSEGYGPINKFYEYLAKKHKIYLIRHPLHLDGTVKNTINYDGKEIIFNIPVLLQYPLEGIISLFYWRKLIKKNLLPDLTLCFDPLCFFNMFILKKFFRLKKIAYYNVDYSKIRFTNPVLNFIYQKINLFAYQKCDYFFSINRRFVKDLDPKSQFIYKNFNISHLAKLPDKNKILHKKKNSIVYAGAINYNLDFDPLLLALKKLKEEKVNFIFDIYGKDKGGFLKAKIAKLQLEKNAFLKGIVENKILTQKILPQYILGVAPYVLEKNPSFPDHAFLGTDLSLKLVEYIAAGLPVIATKPHSKFDVIVKNKFGFIVKNANDWYKAISTLFKNKRAYQCYQKNALQYAKNYDEEKVLEPIFKKILSEH